MGVPEEAVHASQSVYSRLRAAFDTSHGLTDFTDYPTTFQGGGSFLPPVVQEWCAAQGAHPSGGEARENSIPRGTQVAVYSA